MVQRGGVCEIRRVGYRNIQDFQIMNEPVNDMFVAKNDIYALFEYRV